MCFPITPKNGQVPQGHNQVVSCAKISTALSKVSDYEVPTIGWSQFYIPRCDQCHKSNNCIITSHAMLNFYADH